MTKITPNYQLEWEFKAFEELKELVCKKWDKDYDRFKQLTEINNHIVDSFNKDKVERRQFIFNSKDKKLTELFERFLDELVGVDPFLTEIYIYNSTISQDLLQREYIKTHHLPDEELTYLEDLFNLDFLVDSELAKSLSLKGIPLRMLFVGKLLDCLLDDFKHYWLIDKVALEIEKRTGKIESIEGLRKDRISQSKEGLVYDYFPLIKITITKSGPIYEVFNEEDFNNAGEEELMWLADEMLCLFINKTQDDERKNLYFGDNLESSLFKCIVRYGKEEKKFLSSYYQNGRVG